MLVVVFRGVHGHPNCAASLVKFSQFCYLTLIVWFMANGSKINVHIKWVAFITVHPFRHGLILKCQGLWAVRTVNHQVQSPQNPNTKCSHLFMDPILCLWRLIWCHFLKPSLVSFFICIWIPTALAGSL